MSLHDLLINMNLMLVNSKGQSIGLFHMSIEDEFHVAPI